MRRGLLSVRDASPDTGGQCPAETGSARQCPRRCYATRVIETVTLSVEPPPPDRMPLSGETSR